MPDDVAEHYLGLPVDELVTDVLRHYRLNVWPKVEAIVDSHIEEPSTAGVVLERTLAYDSLMVEAANRPGLTLMDVSQSSLPELTDRCLRALSMDQR